MEKYFGNIPSGPPLIKQKQWIAKRSGEHRLVHYDRVPAVPCIKSGIPRLGMDESLYLDLFADVLASERIPPLQTPRCMRIRLPISKRLSDSR